MRGGGATTPTPAFNLALALAASTSASASASAPSPSLRATATRACTALLGGFGSFLRSLFGDLGGPGGGRSLRRVRSARGLRIVKIGVKILLKFIRCRDDGIAVRS